MLPLGGLFIALFAGFVLPKTIVGSQLGLDEGYKSVLWMILIKFCAPVGVSIVFFVTIFNSIS
jgi:NSS family neurotransmitter:Na+ symporter